MDVEIVEINQSQFNQRRVVQIFTYPLNKTTVTVGIRISDKSGFGMVKKCQIVKWFGLRMGIQKPDLYVQF